MKSKLMKTLTLILLAGCNVLSFCACGTDPAETSEKEVYAETKNNTAEVVEETEVEIAEEIPKFEEYIRGKSYGIIPKGIRSNLDKPITYAQYCKMLGNIITAYDSSLTSKWEEVAQDALMSEQEMKRDDGMLATAYAAEILGWDCVNSDWDTINEKMGNNAWEGVSGNYKLFANWEERRTLYKEGGINIGLYCNYMERGYFLSIGRVSVYSQKTLFNYDSRSNSMRAGDVFTRKEAIIAVVRFAESEKYPFLCDKPEYVAIEDIGGHTIDKALYTGETTLPEATNAALPMWRGFIYNDKMAVYEGIVTDSDFQGAIDRGFHESYIKFLGEQGFNFIKVVLNFDTLSYPFYTTDGTVNRNEIKELDELISWGMKYGVHVQISAAGSPGSYKEQKAFYLENDGAYSTCDLDLDTNIEKQESYTRYWKALAKRYADIPNNYLSFNLLNETEFLNEDALVSVYEPLIEAIRSEAPDRVITVPVTSETVGDKIAELGVALTAYGSYASGNNFGIMAMKEVAEKHDIGFMADDIGIGNKNYTGRVIPNYISEITAFFESEGIPYSQCYFFGNWALINDTSGFKREGAKPAIYCFTNKEGRNETIYYDKVLLKTVTENIINTTEENLKETIYRLTSVFENSMPELQYAYSEYLEDGRGLTFGFPGFCSGTFDGTMFLIEYQKLNPDNLLTKYIARFEEIDAANVEGMNPDVEGLENFLKDLEACIDDPDFKQAQLNMVDSLYWTPSQAAADKIGAKLNITKGQFYDAFINHGEDGVKDIIKKATKKAGGTPSSGVDEKVWLAEFLKARLKVLKADKVWSESVDRVYVYQQLLNDGNVNLKTPMTVTCYGDTLEIN